jgi:hypothetical protein
MRSTHLLYAQAGLDLSFTRHHKPLEPMTSATRASVLIVFAIVIAGCASDIVRSSATLAPAGASERQRIQIAEDVTVRSSSGYNRVLPAGSIWELRGVLAQGNVYRRVNDIFTVEGAHMHEAYLVVSGDQLVGYYLPVEQAFSPADPVSFKTR